MITLTYYQPNRAERRLIRALRSGNFTQGMGRLEERVLNGLVYNCCLGVACRVSSRRVKIEIEEASSITPTIFFDRQVFHLPERVRLELNWASPIGQLTITDLDGNFPCLVNLNDEGFTYAQIADLIEWGAVAHLPGPEESYWIR